MRSPSDTFLSESKTRLTFDLQRRFRLLLGQESFDFKIFFKNFSAQNDSVDSFISNYSAVRHKQESLSFPTSLQKGSWGYPVIEVRNKTWEVGGLRDDG